MPLNEAIKAERNRYIIEAIAKIGSSPIVQDIIDSRTTMNWSEFAASHRALITMSVDDSTNCGIQQDVVQTARYVFDSHNIKSDEKIAAQFLQALDGAYSEIEGWVKNNLLEQPALPIVITRPQFYLRREAYLVEFWFWLRWARVIGVVDRELQAPITDLPMFRTPQQAVDVLNELYKLDPAAMRMLSEYGVPCNDELANHPDVFVQEAPKFEHSSADASKWRLRMIGVLNAIFGRHTGHNFGRLAVQEDEKGKLVGFVVTKPPGKISEPRTEHEPAGENQSS